MGNKFLLMSILKLIKNIIKCMTKIILKVWSLLRTKIPISPKSVENSSVMSHSPAAPPVFINSAHFFRTTFHFIKSLDIFGKYVS